MFIFFSTDLKKFCDEQDFGFATVKFISDALKQPLSYDLREGLYEFIFFSTDLKKFCDEQDFGFATVKFISDALKQPLSYDLREGLYELDCQLTFNYLM